MSEQANPVRLTPAAAAAVEAIQALRDALAPVAERATEGLRQMHTVMRPLIEYAEQQPEALEQWERQREAEERLGSCHCLCGAAHRDDVGVCTSVAEPGLTVRFESPTVGPQNVPYCRPCHEARSRRLAAPPTLEEPTATCACHCWANHPSQSGVCSAASVPGIQIGGQPVCGCCYRAAGARS